VADERDRPPRPFDDLRASGLLWLINRALLHPRGYALALHVEGGEAVGWSLLGDGSEPWRYDETDVDEREPFRRLQQTLREARDG
jgi:hypothetical protein